VARGGGAGCWAGRQKARSYEQGAVVVEENDEMEREDERGVAKRPDLNELDVPEWAELALDKVEWRELTAAHRPLARDGDSEPQAEGKTSSAYCKLCTPPSTSSFQLKVCRALWGASSVSSRVTCLARSCSTSTLQVP
jgi:hypothetical protein